MHPSSSLQPSTRGRRAALLVATLAACGPSARPAAQAPSPLANGPATVPRVRDTASSKATLKLSGAWARCHDTFSVAGGDVRGEVERLAQGCAALTKMQRIGEPFTGQQGAADKPQTFRWKAQAGRCYRAYGVGSRAIKNLDLLVEDSLGVVLGQDGSDDGAPVVLDAGAVCFKQDDDASLVVSVGDGTGDFAVELWAD